MSKIEFRTFIDMLTVATPSSGYAIGYDLDGTLKQKDQFGVISPIGATGGIGPAGPTGSGSPGATGSQGATGASGTQSLQQTLSIGNITGPYDIIISDTNNIISSTGSGFISLSQFGQQDYVSIGNIDSYVQFTPTYTALNSLNELYINSSNKSIILKSVAAFTNIGNGVDGDIIISDGVTMSSHDNTIRLPVFISSQNSTVNTGLYNTVLIGGYGLQATQSNTVYLGNKVNINNAYTLPNTDGTSGYVLKTDGLGTVTWQADTSGIGTTPSLCEFYNDGSSIGTTLSTLYTTSGLIDTSNLLAKNGDRFKGVFGGYFTGATASTKSIQLYYGGNPLFGSVATAYESPSYWRVEFCIIRSNSSQIRYDTTFTIYDTVNNTSRTEQVSGSYGGFDFTTDEVIEVMGQSIGAGTLDGDIISRVGYIDYVISR